MIDLNSSPWRELYRCDDLRQARAVATCVAAMEFDVRLCSAAPETDHDGDDVVTRSPGMAMPGRPDATVHFGAASFHPCACNRLSAFAREDDDLPGPYVVEVPQSTWPQLADVLLEIIAEQRDFDQMLELRREQNRVKLVLVLSITTAAEVFLIWRLLET